MMTCLYIATENTLVLLDNCICAGYDVLYECTVCGRGATVWTGSLFNCVGDNIILRHNLFENGLISGECNNGELIARSSEIITKNCTSCFISQLSFSTNNIIPRLVENNNYSTVECLHDDGITETTIDTATVAILTGIILCIIILYANNYSLYTLKA